MNSRRRSRWRVPIGLYVLLLGACGSDSSSLTSLPRDVVASRDSISRQSPSRESVSAFINTDGTIDIEDAAQVLAIYSLPPQGATLARVASAAAILLEPDRATVPVEELPSLFNADVAQPAGVLDLNDVAVVLARLQTTPDNRDKATIAGLATELVRDNGDALTAADVRVVPGEELIGADGQPGGRAIAIEPRTDLTAPLSNTVNELPVSIATDESATFPPGTSISLPRPAADNALRVSYEPPLTPSRNDVSFIEFTAAELGCLGLACLLEDVDVIPKNIDPAPGDYELTFEFRTVDGSSGRVRRVLTVRDAGVDFIPPLPVQLSTALPTGTLAGDVAIEVDGESGSKPFAVRGQNGVATFALAPERVFGKTRYVINEVADATVNLSGVTQFGVFGLGERQCVSVKSLLSEPNSTIAVGDFCPDQPPPPPPPATVRLATSLSNETLAGDVAIEVDASALATESFAIAGTNGTAAFEKSPEQEFGKTRYVVANVNSATVNLGGVTQFNLPGTAGTCVRVGSLLDASTLSVSAPCPDQPPLLPAAATVQVSPALPGAPDPTLAGDIRIDIEDTGELPETFEIQEATFLKIGEEQEPGWVSYAVDLDSAVMPLEEFDNFSVAGVDEAAVKLAYFNAPSNGDSVNLIYRGDEDIVNVQDIALMLAVLQGTESDANFLAAAANEILGTPGLIDPNFIDPIPTSESSDYVDVGNGTLNTFDLAAVLASIQVGNSDKENIAARINEFVDVPGLVELNNIRFMPGRNIPGAEVGNEGFQARFMGSLEKSQSFTGAIEFNVDQDSFVFTLGQTSDFRADIVSSNGATINLFRDLNADELFTSDEFVTDTRNQLQRQLSPGTYLVRLNGLFSSSTSYEVIFQAPLPLQ